MASCIAICEEVDGRLYAPHKCFSFCPGAGPHTSNDPVASAEDALGLTLGLRVDVMFAPIATRFQTYGVRVDGPAKDYMDRRLRPPLLAEWLRLGEEETDFILSLEVGVASISNAGI